MNEPIVWEKMNDLLVKRDYRVNRLTAIEVEIANLQRRRHELKQEICELNSDIEKESKRKGASK